MNAIHLKLLSNDVLISKTHNLVAEERRLNTLLLHHIREIERRGIHLLRGYGSLHAYLVGEFKFSETAAWRRIASMRLMKEIPEAEEAIKTGSLTLSNASRLQGFFREEEKGRKKTYTPIEKKEIFQSIQNKSSLECERVLKTISPESVKKKDRERVVSSEEVELTFRCSRHTLQKLNQVKQLLSHKNPNPSYGKLLEVLADMALQKLDPMEKQQRPRKNPTPISESPRVSTNARYIPATLKEKIWRRASGQCEYRDPETKRRCDSRYKLEIEHIHPVSCGGRTEESNIALFCRAHNIFSAVQILGQQKMKAYVPRL